MLNLIGNITGIIGFILSIINFTYFFYHQAEKTMDEI